MHNRCLLIEGMNEDDQMSSDSRLIAVYPGGKKEIKEYSSIFINILFKNKNYKQNTEKY